MNADYACEKISGLGGRNYKKLQQVRWLKDRDGFAFVVKVLGTPIANDWRKDVSSQTTVECWRRHR